MTQPSKAPSGAKILVQIDPDLQDIVPGFLDNRRNDILTIRSAIPRGDFEAIRMLGHRLKGDGGGYGFEAISEMGAVIEQAAARQDTQALLQQTQAIEDYLNRVEVVYRK